jgi:antitoxin component of RelBE/YafQ-DinJ toxin-antitoxin module
MEQNGEKITGGKRPVRVKKPNAETLAAMEELESGKGDRAANVAEMMAKLNADD